MTEPLSVELCQRLKSTGFPQDRFPQCIYVQVQDDLGGGHGLEWGWREEDWASFNWVACPHWADVLEWLGDQGWSILWQVRTKSDRNWNAVQEQKWNASWTEWIHKKKPQELIEAILDRMEKA